MRTRPLLAAVAVTAGLALPGAAGAAAASPAPPPSAPPAAAVLQEVDGEVTRSYSVPTRHGRLYLEVVHPTLQGEVLPAHGVLTLSPYSVLGRNGEKRDWVPRGYARLHADVVGTGNSGGCFDYGGTREKESAADLVEWVVAQPWSRGRVGMTGGSYDGTTATAAAAMRPAGLATVVPEVGISRWYDYAFSDGMRYSYTNETLGPRGAGAATEEGFDTPLAFDFGVAVPPPLDPLGPEWAERVREAVVVCDEVAHTREGYSTTPDYGAFWAERDYARDAAAVTIGRPQLGDWNVKQDNGYRLFTALTGSQERRMFFGSRWNGHGRPGGDYAAVKKAWMDRWVGGVANGIERTLPAVTSQTADSTGPGAFLAGPTPRTSPLELVATADRGLLPGGGAVGSVGPVPFTLSTETRALAALDAPPSAGYVVLQTPPLTEDVRIFGSPTVRLGLATGRTWTTVAPAVVDVAAATGEDGLTTSAPGPVAVTRGWLDTRYDDGLAERRLGDGTGLRPTVDAKPTDYVFRKGRRIALVVQTDASEWVLPKAYDGALCTGCASWSLELGPSTALTLPVVGRLPGDSLFAPAP